MDAELAQKDPEFVRKTFASIASRYDFANHFLSVGLDFLWRAKVSRYVASLRPSTILDLATGSGDLALALQKACPSAKVVAADFCLPMLEQARRKKVRNLVQADALALPFPDHFFDVVTVAFGLRNMSSWTDALKEMNRVLKPGGTVVILDFSLPEFPPLRVLYRFYLHFLLPRLAHWATKRREAYEYLGGSIENFPSGLYMNALLKSCGFNCSPPRQLAMGVVSIYTGTTDVLQESE
jgi:demethylmenaquinone methyltransferase/2-methoxy-6-polyprenyl-1,4-benzoquinol methylase